MSKYHAEKTIVYGVTFDSRAEARRYVDLMLLQRSGQISGLKRQVPYVLAPGVRLAGEKRKRPAVRYLVDFEYTKAGQAQPEYEDVKGLDTPMGRLKRHLMATVHGIFVRVVK